MVVQQCTYFVYIFWKKEFSVRPLLLPFFLRVMTLLGHCIYACFLFSFSVEAIFQIFLAVMRGKLRPIRDIL